PAVVHPEPIRWIAANRAFKGAIDVGHDGFGRTSGTIFESGNFGAPFDAPFGNADPITNAGVKGATVAQSKNRRRGGGGAVMPKKRKAQAGVAGVLIGK